jgi:adenosylcobinamide-phosphate synthase
MTNALILACALLLDAALGEPRWLWSRAPHPAVLMGRIIGWCDMRFNQGSNKKLKGTACLIALCSAAIALGLFITALPFGWIIELILAAILLAQNSLAAHVRAVGNALRLSTGDGRHAVAQIVGRDTTHMQPPDIARGAIESAAENLSDGVVAPAVWFLIGGLPGIMLYKITNTADSMIGYRTERHKDFGWASARFDDLLNWIPARLTALLIAALHGQLALWRDIIADAKLHRSPNAGWPEAAMSRVLNISLSGPRSYSGTMQDFPYVHPKGRKDAGPDDIDMAVRVLWRVWGAIFGIVILIAVA